jgi:hypothetical protein
MLLADWFTRLARELDLDFTQYGTSGQAFTLGDPTSFHVTAHFVDTPPFLNFIASDPSRQGLVDAIIPKAVAQVESGEFGGVVWYSTEFHEVEFKLSPSFSFWGPLLQRLGSQTSITGWRRLGANILLEFREVLSDNWDEKSQFLAPKAVVHVHIVAPGPCAGQFSSHLAHGVLETVGAICTFALGRPVVPPPTVFPTEPEVMPPLEARRTDHHVLTLARKHISLDVLSPVATPGGLELFRRGRAALITFDAAVKQEHDSVACILYVVAAECLVTPYTEWRRSKLTKRFIEFLDELMATDLDQIVAHANFEETFGIRRGNRSARALRRELLDRIYDYRSGQLHEGLTPTYQGFGVSSDLRNEVRRGLFADFAEGAILRYLAAPRVSLIGHPGFDNDGTSHPDPMSGPGDR